MLNLKIKVHGWGESHLSRISSGLSNNGKNTLRMMATIDCDWLNLYRLKFTLFIHYLNGWWNRFFLSPRSHWKICNAITQYSCAQLISENRIDQFSEYEKCIANCAIGSNDRFRLFNSIQIGYTTLRILCGMATLKWISKKAIARCGRLHWTSSQFAIDSEIIPKAHANSKRDECRRCRISNIEHISVSGDSSGSRTPPFAR